MGTFTVTVGIGDPQGERSEEVEALVDSGATYTTLPASMLNRLGVTPVARGKFVPADGRRVDMDMGETRIRIGDQVRSSMAIFGAEGQTPLLGGFTFEAFLLGVDPVDKRLAPVEGYLMAATVDTMAVPPAFPSEQADRRTAYSAA